MIARHRRQWQMRRSRRRRHRRPGNRADGGAMAMPAMEGLAMRFPTCAKPLVWGFIGGTVACMAG